MVYLCLARTRPTVSPLPVIMLCKAIFNYSELAKLMCKSWLYFKYVTAGTIQLHVDVAKAKLAAGTHLLYSHEEDISFAIPKNSLQNCELFF